MLEILESIHTFPIRMMAVKGLKYEPGRIVEIAEVDNNTCCIVSDGTRPFGIVGGELDKWGLVPVWYDSMVLRTDLFETSCVYNAGDLVYVSERGLMTTEKCYENSLLIGHIISGPFQNQPCLEMNWI